jgi:predicted nucleic acid-binding protein
MYLLGTQEFTDLASRDTACPIFAWLQEVKPSQTDLFISAISVGILHSSVEALQQQDRENWRRLLAQAKRSFDNAGGIIDVDMGIVETWAGSLRGLDLIEEDPATGGKVQLGEDARLVVATAIRRGYTLVTRRVPYLDDIAISTTLTIVEP